MGLMVVVMIDSGRGADSMSLEMCGVPHDIGV
jgi:hypothetical protein